MLGVNAQVILVAEVTLAIFLCPRRIGILLRPLIRIRLPLRENFPRFQVRFFILAKVLFRYWNQGGINNLPPLRVIALFA